MQFVQNLGLGRRFLMLLLMEVDYVDDYDDDDDGALEECRRSSGMQGCVFALTKVRDDMNRVTCLTNSNG